MFRDQRLPSGKERLGLVRGNPCCQSEFSKVGANSRGAGVLAEVGSFWISENRDACGSGSADHSSAELVGECALGVVREDDRMNLGDELVARSMRRRDSTSGGASRLSMSSRRSCWLRPTMRVFEIVGSELETTPVVSIPARSGCRQAQSAPYHCPRNQPEKFDNQGPRGSWLHWLRHQPARSAAHGE